VEVSEAIARYSIPVPLQKTISNYSIFLGGSRNFLPYPFAYTSAFAPSKQSPSITELKSFASAHISYSLLPGTQAKTWVYSSEPSGRTVDLNHSLSPLPSEIVETIKLRLPSLQGSRSHRSNTVQLIITLQKWFLSLPFSLQPPPLLASSLRRVCSTPVVEPQVPLVTAAASTTRGGLMAAPRPPTPTAMPASTA
jgi:hypothetical protein